MRFVADENCPQPIIERLRSLGADVLAVREAMPGSTDGSVLDLVVSTGRILITADNGFGDLVLRSDQSIAGLVLLELAPLPPRAQADRVAAVIADAGVALVSKVTVI